MQLRTVPAVRVLCEMLSNILDIFLTDWKLLQKCNSERSQQDAFFEIWLSVVV